MATLSRTLGPSPATYAWRTLPADAVGRRYSGAPQRQLFGAILSDGAAAPIAAAPAAEAPTASESAPEERPSLTRLEVAAIHIGKSDPLPILESGGRLARLGRFLFGSKQPNALANERLEALRLVVIALRRHGRSPQDAIEAALAAGIPRSQLDALAAGLQPSTAL
jgi:hypothetical protein